MMMLSRRQIHVQRENIAAMCRISVKSLLDHACLYTHVDDDCEEFINFCAVFEQLVSHRLRPYQKKVWLPGQGSPRHFWDLLLENYNRSRQFLFESCIPNIEAIETFKSPKTKLRAFIRVALMEKRLSDYMFCLLDNTSLMCDSYLDGALLTSEEAAVLCGDLIGLNAVDFKFPALTAIDQHWDHTGIEDSEFHAGARSFCLKGNENEWLGPLEISYGPFLKYRQTMASRYSDDLEMLRLSGKETEEDMHPGAILTESNINDILRLQSLEKNVSQIKEQKPEEGKQSNKKRRLGGFPVLSQDDYLEELVRLRERQIKETNNKMENMKIERNLAERAWQQECRTMDACILELQAEMGKLRKQNEALHYQVTSLRQFKQRMEMREVPLVDMATGDDREVEKSGLLMEMEQIEERLSLTRSALKKKQVPIPADQRSILSLTSDHAIFPEDSHSMLPLAGSLVDVSVSHFGSETKKYPRDEIIPEGHLNFSSGENIKYTFEIEREHIKCPVHPAQPIKDTETFMAASTLADGSEYIIVPETFSSTEAKDLNRDSQVNALTTISAKIEDSLERFVETDINTPSQEGNEDAEVNCSNFMMENDVKKENISSLEQPQIPTDFEDTPGNIDEMLEIASGTSGCAEDTLSVIEDVQKLSVDSYDTSSDRQNPMATSDHSSCFESEKEEEVVMSEPELINPSNSGSESSDAAWEILSDSENKSDN